MKNNCKILYWDGCVIGTVLDPNFDNFDFYGGWSPIDDAGLYKKFLEQVAQEGGAWVSIGQVDSSLVGTVELEPDHEINIKLRLRGDQPPPGPGLSK